MAYLRFDFITVNLYLKQKRGQTLVFNVRRIVCYSLLFNRSKLKRSNNVTLKRDWLRNAVARCVLPTNAVGVTISGQII